jgi:hypothetical protein
MDGVTMKTPSTQLLGNDDEVDTKNDLQFSTMRQKGDEAARSFAQQPNLLTDASLGP